MKENGGQNGQYLDPTTTYVRFKASCTSAGVLGTDYSNIFGSAYSYFNKQECYGNNSVLLESINEMGVLANLLLCRTLNDADRRGLSPAIGFVNSSAAYAASATQGHKIIVITNSGAIVFENAVPLIGINYLKKNLLLLYNIHIMATTNPYGCATDIQVGSSLPIEMNYALSASLVAAKNFEISGEKKKTPVNTQSFTAGNVLKFDLR